MTDDADGRRYREIKNGSERESAEVRVLFVDGITRVMCGLL